MLDGHEIQIATVGAGPSHEEQSEAVRLAGVLLDGASPGPAGRAWRVLPLPATVPLPDLLDRSGESTAAGSGVATPSVRLGVGGDTAAPLDLPLGQATRFLVIGPPRSGRSNVIEVVGRQLLEQARHVAVVSGRRSTHAQLGKQGAHLVSALDCSLFIDLRRAHPDLAVLIDDADALEGTDLDRALLECLHLVDGSGGLVWATADTARANAAFRGLLPALARDGNGLALSPSGPGDGECLRARPEAAVLGVPGRGSLVLDAQCTPIQVACSGARPRPGFA